MATLSEMFETALAGARGVGQGASMGLHRYPAAVAMMGMDQLARLGGGKGELTYEEALRGIREQDAYDVANNPLARTGGELLGMVGTGVTSAGGRLLAQAARGAGQGAISGFTANEGMDNALEDTGLGAVMGGVLGGAGKVASKAQARMAKPFALTRQQGYLDEGVAAVDKLTAGGTALGDVFKKAGVNSAEEAAKQIRRIANTRRGTPKLGDVKLSKEAIAEARVIDRARGAAKKIEDITKGTASDAAIVVGARGPAKEALKNSVVALRDISKEVAPTAVAAGGLGAAKDIYEGNTNWDNAKNFATLAGGAKLLLGKTNVANDAANALAVRMSPQLGENAARLATRFSVPVVAQGNQARREQENFEPVPWATSSEAPAEQPQTDDFVPVPWK